METTITIGTIFIAWVACGVVCYAGTLADFQKGYNYYGIAKRSRKEDVKFAVVFGFLGPIGLAITVVDGRFKNGLLFRPIADEEINYGGKE